MKAEYNMKIVSIDAYGEKTEWSDNNIRIKVLFTLECENGKIQIFEGILKKIE